MKINFQAHRLKHPKSPGVKAHQRAFSGKTSKRMMPTLAFIFGGFVTSSCGRAPEVDKFVGSEVPIAVGTQTFNLLLSENILPGTRNSIRKVLSRFPPVIVQRFSEGDGKGMRIWVTAQPRGEGESLFQVLRAGFYQFGSKRIHLELPPPEGSEIYEVAIAHEFSHAMFDFICPDGRITRSRFEDLVCSEVLKHKAKQFEKAVTAFLVHKKENETDIAQGRKPFSAQVDLVNASLPSFDEKVGRLRDLLRGDVWRPADVELFGKEKENFLNRWLGDFFPDPYLLYSFWGDFSLERMSSVNEYLAQWFGHFYSANEKPSDTVAAAGLEQFTFQGKDPQMYRAVSSLDAALRQGKTDPSQLAEIFISALKND